jgi:hypothetical protein
VRAVQCFTGPAAWKAAKDGLWSRDLLDAALAPVPGKVGRVEEVDRDATVFVIEYTDGLRAAGYLSPKHTTEFAVGLQAAGRDRPVGTWCYLPKPQRDHFSFLCNHIETDVPDRQAELPGGADAADDKDAGVPDGFALSGRQTAGDAGAGQGPLQPQDRLMPPAQQRVCITPARKMVK